MVPLRAGEPIIMRSIRFPGNFPCCLLKQFQGSDNPFLLSFQEDRQALHLSTPLMLLLLQAIDGVASCTQILSQAPQPFRTSRWLVPISLRPVTLFLFSSLSYVLPNPPPSPIPFHNYKSQLKSWLTFLDTADASENS